MDWERFCEESAEMDGDEDCERLLRFDESLFGASHNDALTEYVQYTIRSVNAIKFSAEWDTLAPR